MSEEGNVTETWVALLILGVLAIYLVLRLVIWVNAARLYRKAAKEGVGGASASARPPPGQGPTVRRKEMDITWTEISRRIVDGLGVQRGELIAVRDNVGRIDVLLEILLAIELRGASPDQAPIPCRSFVVTESAERRTIIVIADQCQQHPISQLIEHQDGGIGPDLTTLNPRQESLYRRFKAAQQSIGDHRIEVQGGTGKS